MLGKNPSLKETKAAIDEVSTIAAFRVPRLVKEGYLPITAKHLEDNEYDMRSSYPWIIAYMELRDLPYWEEINFPYYGR